MYPKPQSKAFRRIQFRGKQTSRKQLLKCIGWCWEPESKGGRTVLSHSIIISFITSPSLSMGLALCISHSPCSNRCSTVISRGEMQASASPTRSFRSPPEDVNGYFSPVPTATHHGPGTLCWWPEASPSMVHLVQEL